MVTRLGTLSHAKGFVVNKLYEQKRFGGAHVPVMFLRQGYPPKWRHFISQAIEDLRNEGIIRIEPHRTGRNSGDHARLERGSLARARGLLNAYRRAEGLPTLGRDLKTLLPVRTPKKFA